jgi:hypothetical protein
MTALHLGNDVPARKLLASGHQCGSLSPAVQVRGAGVSPFGTVPTLWNHRSRAFGFQPYLESGFPHDHDQWISMAATAWSSMALMPVAEAAKTVLKEQDYPLVRGLSISFSWR